METNCGYSFDGVISCDEGTKEVRVSDCVIRQLLESVSLTT